MPERRRLKLGSGPGLVGVSAAASAAAASSAALLAAANPLRGDADGADEVPALRMCGRCRKRPSADPALYPKARREWWLCPSCHEALFGR
jgi:hypothetical protein